MRGSTLQPHYHTKNKMMLTSIPAAVAPCTQSDGKQNTFLFSAFRNDGNYNERIMYCIVVINCPHKYTRDKWCTFVCRN